MDNRKLTGTFKYLHSSIDNCGENQVEQQQLPTECVGEWKWVSEWAYFLCVNKERQPLSLGRGVAPHLLTPRVPRQSNKGHGYHCRGYCL